MQHKGVQILGVQMSQRAVEGLRHLGGESGRGIVRGSMVLAIRRRKLGLKKETVSRDPLLGKGQQGLAHQGFLVMDLLVGRIDGCEARRHR